MSLRGVLEICFLCVFTPLYKGFCVYVLPPVLYLYGSIGPLGIYVDYS